LLLGAQKATALRGIVAVAHPSLDSFDALFGGKAHDRREIDIHTLPSMLTGSGPASFHKLWPRLPPAPDNEGWPAARFLARSGEL